MPRLTTFWYMKHNHFLTDVLYGRVWYFDPRCEFLNSFYFLHTKYIFFFHLSSLYSFQCWIINSPLFCSIGIHEGASFKSWMLTWCNVKEKKTKALATKTLRLHIERIFFEFFLKFCFWFFTLFLLFVVRRTKKK